MHHIFFPPRLQVVAAQQHPDCFPPHLWNQFSFHRLFGDQTHRPARLALRRIAAHHGNDPLLFRRIQQLFGSTPAPLVKRLLQATLLISMSNSPDRLSGQMHDPGHDRSRLSGCQLIQGDRTQDHSHLLNPGAKDLPNRFLILAGKLEVDRAS